MIFFIEFLEIVSILLLFAFIFFQVILPIWRGTVFFPSFRSKSRQLERQLREARLNIELLEEEKKLNELKGKTNATETRI